MKRFISHFLLCASLIGAFPVLAAKGPVVFIKGDCSYYIVQTPKGFALLQWFGGSLPWRGDILTGDFESFGVREIYNLTRGSETKVMVESYWLSNDVVVERYLQKCN